jgi:uncharacterized UPF0160 family protein
LEEVSNFLQPVSVFLRLKAAPITFAETLESLKGNRTMRIATHNTVFHADDSVAAAILLSVFPGAKIVRSREKAVIEEADIVFDVGGSYDGIKFFDHHQRGGAGTRENGVPFAAAGLIWKHFGVQFCQALAAEHDIAVAALVAAVDEKFIQGIDATDCGATESTRHLKGNPGVPVELMSISLLISSLNPVSLMEESTPAEFDASFGKAVELAGLALQRVVLGEVSQLKAKNIVRSSDLGSPVLELTEFCPWEETVVSELDHVQFVIFQAPDGGWRVQTVPVAVGQFKARLDLPENWAGLRDENFKEATGVNDAVFCHPGRFIAGALSKEGVKRLAELALA